MNNQSQLSDLRLIVSVIFVDFRLFVVARFKIVSLLAITQAQATCTLLFMTGSLSRFAPLYKSLFHAFSGVKRIPFTGLAR